jgi:Stage II sporulation protein E (SpoIIE)
LRVSKPGIYHRTALALIRAVNLVVPSRFEFRTGNAPDITLVISAHSKSQTAGDQSRRLAACWFVLRGTRVHGGFEWYIFETPPPGCSPLLGSPVQLGPFATETECCELVASMKAIPRFRDSSLEVHKKSRRRERRFKVELPVRVCRAAGEEKSQAAYTLDISTLGARLGGLHQHLQPGEVIQIYCGRREAPFRVTWCGSPRSATEGQIGVECLVTEANIWDLELTNASDHEPLLQEIAVARTVQSRLFPQEMPALRTLDYDGNCIQARIVGGDYYDFFEVGAGEIAFVLADVAGKGVAAALLMANLQGALRSNVNIGSRDLPRWLGSVNRHFFKHTENNRYATLFLGCYFDGSRSFRYVNCGHNPPLLLRRSGEVEPLKATATVVGLFRNWTCTVAETRIEPGDVLCTYTDGVTETVGIAGEEFGEARLLDALRGERGKKPAAILRNVEDAVRHFREGEQGDDLTLMIACGR